MFSMISRRNLKAKTTGKPAARGKNGVTSRTVVHQRWIHTSELKRGMYVAELNVPWDETSFMFQGFDVDSEQLITEIQQAATHALVKTQKVAQTSTKSARQFCTA